MNRNDLLNRICPITRIYDCSNSDTTYLCNDCKQLLSKMLDEYDKYVIEQYNADINLKDTIKNIHDSVSIQMYCKGIDDLCKAITNATVYDECRNEIDVLELAWILKKNSKHLKWGVKYEV